MRSQILQPNVNTIQFTTKTVSIGFAMFTRLFLFVVYVYYQVVSIKTFFMYCIYPVKLMILKIVLLGIISRVCIFTPLHKSGRTSSTWWWYIVLLSEHEDGRSDRRLLATVDDCGCLQLGSNTFWGFHESNKTKYVFISKQNVVLFFIKFVVCLHYKFVEISGLGQR